MDTHKDHHDEHYYYAALSTPPSSPSGPANPDRGAVGPTRSGFQRARQIVESHVIYEELLSRYRWAATRLEEVTREADALREENEWLRLANEDLTRRLERLLISSSSSSDHRDDQSGGLNRTVVAAGSNSSTDHQWNYNDNINNNGGRSSVGSSSPMSVVEQGEDEQEIRISMPKSISVRSPGYFKLPTYLHPPSPAASALSKTRLRMRKQEKAIEVEVYRQGMYKTELCDKWQDTGSCPYGHQCQFAHGLSELRPVVRHPRYKTQVCRMVLAGTTCPYGHRCHFLHSLPQL